MTEYPHDRPLAGRGETPAAGAESAMLWRFNPPAPPYLGRQSGRRRTKGVMQQLVAEVSGVSSLSTEGVS
jgi:hypothetical protein